MISKGLTKSFLKAEFDRAKAKAGIAVSTNRYNKALLWYKYACRVIWEFPILTDYFDDEIESSIVDLTDKFVEHCDLSRVEKSGVVFYCGWLGDNMALIEQYLYYFIENNIPTLLVVQEKSEINRGAFILSQVEKAPNIKLFIPDSSDLLQNVISIRNEIRNFAPAKAFLHFWPNDVVGLAVFSGVKGIPRYYINHADHLFWIGKKCADFFIEFRRLGIRISKERRKIDDEKILQIPFYPINNGKLFQGFPFEAQGKVIGISGGNLYKYCLDNELRYFKVIARLLKENEKFVFCLCGIGTVDRIRKIFIENNVSDRFFYLGERKDFYNLVSKCDLMFESYPLKGGLVRLFAIEQDVPIIGITASDNQSGTVQDALELENYKEPADFEEFYNRALQLVRSSEERRNLVNILSQNRFNKTEFDKALGFLFQGKYQALMPKSLLSALNLNDDEILDAYLKLPNATKFNLAFRKLLIVRGQISFLERLELLPLVLKHFKFNKYKETFRLVSIIFVGH